MSQQQVIETIKTTEVTLNDRFLTVGNQRFHYIWLRDNCLSPECHHASSFQKIYDISDRTQPPKPKSAYIQNEKLFVDWDEDPPHRSIYPLSWLWIHAYDVEAGVDRFLPKLESPPKDKKRDEKILWNRSDLDANPPKLFDVASSTFASWIDQLDTLGFVILRNLAYEDLDSFVKSIGPIYELSGYGRYCTVKAVRNGPDLSVSYAGDALSPHVDLTFTSAPRIVQLLYCVENQASGGESVLVDGYRVARDFREHHPRYFQILSQTPVQFRQFYQEWGYFVSRTTPIIKLDAAGEVADIYFSHKNFGLNIPFEQMEAFYEAYTAFAGYLKDPAYQYWFRMEAGDCQLVQNFRILHGRKAFDPSSGTRHLEIAYMEWMYYAGRRDFDRVKPVYLSEFVSEYQ
ncbi:MAG: TauD/TfdA family dioxygenase [Geitlerinemataceae cyanobacterium]